MLQFGTKRFSTCVARKFQRKMLSRTKIPSALIASTIDYSLPLVRDRYDQEPFVFSSLSLLIQNSFSSTSRAAPRVWEIGSVVPNRDNIDSQGRSPKELASNRAASKKIPWRSTLELIHPKFAMFQCHAARSRCSNFVCRNSAVTIAPYRSFLC